MTSLLPPNATLLERAFDALLGERIGAVESSYRAWWSAQDCPEQDLPWLAWAVSIDEWDPAWPEYVRRAQVAKAVELHRRKGTVAAVKSVVAGFGGAAALREWWEYATPATPHTFDLVVSLGGTSSPSTELVDGVLRAINAAKPLRSHFTFTLAQTVRGQIGIKGAARAAVFVRLGVNAPPTTVPANAMTLAGDTLTLSGDFLTIGA